MIVQLDSFDKTFTVRCIGKTMELCINMENTKNLRVAPFGEAFTIRCSVPLCSTEHQ